jgi:WD40 repeat protein
MPRPAFQSMVAILGWLVANAGDLCAQELPKGTAPTDERLPAGAIHRFGNRQLRHPEPILWTAVSPDGKYLATAGENSVIVWDLKTLVPKCVLTDQSVNDPREGGGPLAFLADSNSLVVPVQHERRRPTETRPDYVRVFDIDSGKLRFALQTEPGLDTAVWPAAGGKELAVLRDQSLSFVSARDGKELRRAPLDTRIGDWSTLAFAADRLAVWNPNRSALLVLDVVTKKELYAATAPNGVSHAVLSPDGKVLVHETGGKVSVHDVEAKKSLFSFDHPSGRGFVPLLVSADRSRLYLGSRRGEIACWDLTTGERRPDVGRHGSKELTGLALSPDGLTLYSVSEDCMVRRWDLKAGKEIPLPDGYVGQTAIARTPDGKHLVIADHAGRIDLWDLATGQLAKQLQASGGEPINALTVSPDGRWLACGRMIPQVQLWDLRTGKVERVFPVFDQSADDDVVQRLAFSSDGRVLFVGINGIGPTACEIPSGKRLWNYNGGGYNLAADPGGRFIATGKNGRPTVITVLDAPTGTALRSMALDSYLGEDERRSDITTVDRAFTPDGSRLVTFHEDGSIRVWNPATGREVARLKSATDGEWRPGGLAVSADGKWVAVRENRPTRRMLVWELASGKQVFAITGHDSLVRDLAFTRDARGLIGNADLAPVLWSLEPKDLPGVIGSADAMWETLASEEADKAYRLQWALARNPKSAVKLFSDKVQPNEMVIDRGLFDKWVANLNSPQFRMREATEKKIGQTGFRVPVEWLVTAQSVAPSEEVRVRLERLLLQREQPGPEEWRLLRAVQTLELAGTDEAKQLLRAWTAAPEGSLLAIDAKGALARLAK